MHALFKFSVVVAGAFLSIAIGATTAAWEPIGPPGGVVTNVAIDPQSPARMYAETQRVGASPTIYRSNDHGMQWERVRPPPNCRVAVSYLSKSQAVVVRDDGQVFVRCHRAIWRSRDAGTTWEAFSPSGVDGWLVFAPGHPRHAAIRRGGLVSPDAAVFVTADDGATWQMIPTGTSDVVPQVIVFDPATPGRLLGAYSDFMKPSGGYPALLLERRDGDVWRPVGKIVEASMYDPSCMARDLVADAAGLLLAHTECGLARSVDHGQSWQPLNGIKLNTTDLIAVAPATPGHIVVVRGSREIWQSKDRGDSWQALPTPAWAYAPIRVAISSHGDLWAATGGGVYRGTGDPPAWVAQNAGIHERWLLDMAIGAGPQLTIATIGARSPNAVSVDGGGHWADWSLSDQPTQQLTVSVNAPQWVYALDGVGALHSSSNGGATWQLVNAQPDVKPYVQLGSVLPVGPQPGLVYAIGQSYESNVFGFPALLVGKGVLRSENGGKSWSRVGMELPWPVEHLAASPVDASALMVSTGGGVVATRDARTAGAWQPVLPTRAIPTPDPVSPSRWYVHGEQSGFAATDDFGATWRAIGNPLLSSPTWALLVDPIDPATLIAVGRKGEVTRSADGGNTWRRLLEPADHLELQINAIHMDPQSSATIYAAGSRGVLRFAATGDLLLGTVSVVEFYHPDLRHYFITADPLEIAALDAGQRPFWKRTGETFNVYAASTRTDEVTSPVCRFYGRPGKGLDSHFFSASTTECAAVQERFADSWILETPSAFSAFLPSPDGTCPAGSRPVYRVYNNRSDINHRYVTSAVVRDEMVSQGWIAEGYGPASVAMCAP